MMRKILFLALILGLAGCAGSQPAFDNPARPGMANINGAQVQLLFSNPNYDRDHDVEDVQTETFREKGGMPAVTGGVGAMSIWHF